MVTKFFDEFKAFLSRGNVVDLAVAVIIGGAFQPVVSSMVNDVLMPPIGIALGKVNFTELKFVIQAADATNNVAEVAVKYGMFIQKIIDFVIIGFCVFLLVKAYTKMQSMRKKEEAAAAPAAPTKDQELLTEIRDLLKK
ncbi:MAG: large-conductance mechanosensitive channel protein MscL [Candidatus Caenarcaniphilales bacterium]|jgi:large conductance mechanosensitive channel|nr:large-conductance mechanosensitive channel protein MscL [Candidatus Caenarcaniphilales bacterium]